MKQKTEEKRTLSLKDVSSILESTLFALGNPLSMQDLLQLFHTEKIPTIQIKEALSLLEKKYQSESSGLELQKVAGAYQLRTKEENKDYIRRLIKGRLFQLSAPAMEVLSIVAYQQLVTKANVDEVRGVESGHLLRTLMEKDLVTFGPKSSEFGRPSTYKTTSKFLETFSLKSLSDLPSPNELADLLPSEEETSSPIPPLKRAVKGIQKSVSYSLQERAIEEELQFVSEKIDSVKPQQPWSKE